MDRVVSEEAQVHGLLIAIKQSKDMALIRAAPFATLAVNGVLRSFDKLTCSQRVEALIGHFDSRNEKEAARSRSAAHSR